MCLDAPSFCQSATKSGAKLHNAGRPAITVRMVQHSKPSELAERYFNCIRARDIDGLAQLYEDDATFALPNGREFIGKAAILDMQREVFSHGSLTPTPVSTITGANAVAVEIETRLPDGTVRRMADHFYLSEAGRIQRLCIFAQAG